MFVWLRDIFLCAIVDAVYQMGVNHPADIASGRIAEAFLNDRKYNFIRSGERDENI